MIRLFVSDLDGTLLNNKTHVASAETIAAVKALRAQGISFMPASGRDYVGLQMAIKALNIKPKCVCLNGAEFYDNDGTLLISNPLHKDTVVEIQTLLETLPCYVDYYCEDGRYTVYTGDNFKEYMLERLKHLLHGEEMHDTLAYFEDNDIIKTTTTISSLLEIENKKVLKIELLFENMKEKNNCYQLLKSIDGIITTASHELNLEINAIEATKGHMIEQICEIYGYHKDEVVVVGDGINDIPMLERFPHSYAMGQAPDIVKRAANYITEANEDHGVAELIYKILDDTHPK